MQAKIKELWLIVECPHCQRPQVKCFGYVDGNGKVFNLDEVRILNCKVCAKRYELRFEKGD